MGGFGLAGGATACAPKTVVAEYAAARGYAAGDETGDRRGAQFRNAGA